MKPLTETHGRIEEANSKPTTLEQVWGMNESAKFGTTDEKTYLDKVQEMNRAELEVETRKVGLVVVESTARLRENLVREFRKYFALLRQPTETMTGAVTKHDNREKMAREVAKILADGR